MKTIALIIYVVLISNLATAQQRLQLPLAISGYTPEYSNGTKNKCDEFPLFDLDEIKNRKIRTAYIIYHPGSWADYDTLYNKIAGKDNTPPWCDTTGIYRFDEHGRITQFAQLSAGLGTIHDYDPNGNRTAETKIYFLKNGIKKYARREYPDKNTFDTTDNPRVETKKEKKNNDSIITVISFFKNPKTPVTKFEKRVLDTIQIRTDRYNAQKLLVEVKNLDFYDDTQLNNYHYRYGYDKQKRLAYFHDFKKGEYTKISYPFYGMLIETYDSKTDSLKSRLTKLIDIEDHSVKATTKDGQAILTRLEKGSKLYKLITVTSTNEFPSIHYEEIVYE